MNKLQKIPEISPTFCIYPWMQFILGPAQHIKLCCLSETKIKDENGKAYTFEKNSLEDCWNGYGLRQIRKKMLAGEKLKACEHCYYQESLGRTSCRQYSSEEWFKSKSGKEIFDRVKKSRINGYRVYGPPLYLDIRPGNLCNLKCRMCNPENSSKIHQEQKELLKENPLEFTPLIDTSYFEKNEKNHISSWHKNEDIWKNIYKWASGAKQLYFTGGEPTLIKENWELIDHLKQKGYSKNIHLIFNINCTQAPDKLIDTFEAFSTVEINFSIDGYKEVQEYIRYPSQWKEIESNIIKILKNKKENVHFNFTPVVQVYNILNITQILQWIDELQITYGKIKTNMVMCTGPEFLDIAILPKIIKRKALSRIEEHIENIKDSYKKNDSFLLECLFAITKVLKTEEKNDIKKHLKRFYKYTTLLDKKRGDNFKKTFPELNNLFEEDGRWKN